MSSLSTFAPTSAANSVWTDICGCQRLIECADISDISDNWGGTLQTTGYVEPSNGRVLEVNRWRAYQPSTAVLTIPLDSAQHFMKLRDKGCETSIQIRSCNNTDSILHMSGVQIDSLRFTNLTASGIGAQNGIPMVSMPLVFRKLYEVRTNEVTNVDGGGNQMEQVIMGVAYCECANCCGNCSECSTIYRITQEGQLHVSYDSGETWANIAHCIYSPFESIWCIYGRIYIATYNGNLWYSDNPTDPLSWNSTLRYYGQVLWLEDAGTVLYAVTKTSTGVRIHKSIDRGVKWVIVYEVEGDFTTFATDGDYIVLAGTDGHIVISEDGGRTWTTKTMVYGNETPDIVAIDILSPPRGYSKCFTVYVADHDNNLYSSSDWKDWRKIKRGNGGSARYHIAYLKVEAEGGIIWYHRVINDKPTTIKGNGDCCTWQVSDFSVTKEMVVPEQCEFFACFDDDCQVSALLRCPGVGVPEELACEIVYGCTTDEWTYIFRCGDCPDTIYLGQPKIVEGCNEPCDEVLASCTEDCEDCEDAYFCNPCLVSSQTTMPVGVEEVVVPFICWYAPIYLVPTCLIEDEEVAFGCTEIIDDEEVVTPMMCVISERQDEPIAFGCVVDDEEVLIGCTVTVETGCRPILPLYGCSFGGDGQTGANGGACCQPPNNTEITDPCNILVENPDNNAVFGCIEIIEGEEICTYYSCDGWDIECLENEYLPIEYEDYPVGGITLFGENCYLESPCADGEYLTLCDDDIPLTSHCSSGCAEGCEKEISTGVFSVWAFCPSDPNVSIAIGSEILLSN